MTELKLDTPEEFPFPFTPYKIQEDFMKQLYTALEQQMCGIFESPTGTGKSLSIICGAIKWLKDYNELKQNSLKDKIKELQQQIKELQSESTDWLTSQSKEIEISRELHKLKLEDGKIEEYYKKINDLKRNKRKMLKSFSAFQGKENKSNNSNKTDDLKDENVPGVEDDDLLLDDIVEVRNEDDIEEEIEEKYSPTKIYICSRTHSQLSQLVGEIRKSPYGKDIRVVSLASRQNYCINPVVNHYKNNALINEKCLDMQKNSKNKATKVDLQGKTLKRKKTETNCKCKFFKQEAIEDLRDAIILNVLDVEDLVTTGKDFSACPYYASRKAVDDAEVILVPYNTILHRATREANGIKLKDNIVIIDEAHNLLDALGQMYGATVTIAQLQHAHQQLKGYKTKYGKRFSAGNLLCINQLLTIVTALKNVFDSQKVIENDGTKIFTVNDFVSLAEIDHFNMFNLVEFVKNSKLSQKLHGFTLRHSEQPIIKPKVKIETPEDGYKKFQESINEELNQNKPKTSKSKNTITKKVNTVTTNTTQTIKNVEVKTPQPANPLLTIVSFLETLQNVEKDGRILMHSGTEKKLQYLLLNPSSHFSSIVKDARAVIVAGGTMKPISEFRERLFINAGADPARVMHFTCDHIVPPENILPLVLTDNDFLFNYANRFSMATQIRLILTSACSVVKGGIVVFFPSYQYEAWVWGQFKDVDFGRPVFREPQETGSVDLVLESYHKAIYKSSFKKAMLFSVVGGKLSEGLNFSDDLGRCVIVFGLPYANVNSPDLKEKMTYLDRNEGYGAGKKFYENLCMKAVNQCIGRAVRHINDYATVLLVDVRYNRPATKSALPDWIKRSLKTCEHSKATELMKQFFASKT